MKKLFAVAVLVCFITACSTTYKPVASIQELWTEEEVEKSRNWIEPDSPEKQAAAFASGLAGGLLIGLPLAMALASIPDEKGMTMPELAEKVAAKTCDRSKKFTRYANNLSEDLGIVGVNLGDDDTTGLRPIGLMYISKSSDEKRIFSEVRLVKKIDENTYWNWRVPLLKKTESGNLVYVLNEKLRLDGPVTMKAGSEMFQFAFIDESTGGVKVTKSENELMQDMKSYFMGNSFEMETMKCALGDKVCGAKAREAADADKTEASTQAGETAL
jgi:hypothetical protein